jgi:hypothetical protein
MNPMTQMNNNSNLMNEPIVKNRKRTLRWVLALMVVVGAVILGILAIRNPQLFKAELTQTGSAGNSNNNLYIPDNYTATSPQSSDTVSVKVGDKGIGNECIQGIDAHFTYDPTQITFDSSNPITLSDKFGGYILSPSGTSKATDATHADYHVTITGKSAVNFAKGDALFTLRLSVASGLASNTAINVTPGTVKISVSKNDSAASSPCSGSAGSSADLTSIAAGKISVGVAKCTASNWTCGGYGACGTDGTKTRTCTAPDASVCDSTGVTGPSTTGVCACPTDDASWGCTAWSTCSSGGTQTRSCPTTPSNCQGARPATSQSCSYTPPTANCFLPLNFTIPGTDVARSALHPNITIANAASGWTLDGAGVTVATGKPTTVTETVGKHTGNVPGVGTCQFNVECYTSIDVAGVKNSIGSTDPAKIALYDYNGDGKIDVADKKAILAASQQCN